MSRTHTRLATVSTAERPNPDRPTEDRIFTVANTVAVLDGASQPDEGPLSGGWLADTLGRELEHRLASDSRDLAQILADAIDTVTQQHQLSPGGPSTTVSIIRWTDHDVDALVLGDSPVIAFTHDGQVHQLRDERLHQVTEQNRQQATSAGAGFACDQLDSWRQLVAAQRAQRNRDGGYWIAEADPAAAFHAVRAHWSRDDLAAILVMTDGVSLGVDRYGVPPDWPTALAIARHDPGRLLDLVHDTETGDPDGTRWPRSKRHDDKAVAVIQLDGP
jgi:Protein phosphatase 2C